MIPYFPHNHATRSKPDLPTFHIVRALRSRSRQILLDLKHHLSDLKYFQFVYQLYYTIVAHFHFITCHYYLSLGCCCKVKRRFTEPAGNRPVNRLYARLHNEQTLRNGCLPPIAQNTMLHQFLTSRECAAIRREWLQYDSRHVASLKYPRSNDFPQRQGNLVLLKQYCPSSQEKGVIYLKYNESLKQFPALFDLSRIAQHYSLVLEPSTWGYMEEQFHLFIGSDLNVIVQAQDALDYSIIQNMAANLVPIRLGAGDWIDTDVFTYNQPQEKLYDIIMIASWSKIKRHRILFKALAAEGLRHVKVVLIGYPWEGRTREDIETEARYHHVLDQITIFENVPRIEVSKLIHQSRVAVMLSKREGANRAIYECLLSGIPVVLYKYNRGVNRDIINAETGCLADDEHLGRILNDMVNNAWQYQNVGTWARDNIGRKVAHGKLNACLRDAARKRGDQFTHDICEIKADNAAYVFDSDRIAMESEYVRLIEYIQR